jgi:hypothetical protein
MYVFISKEIRKHTQSLRFLSYYLDTKVYHRRQVMQVFKDGYMFFKYKLQPSMKRNKLSISPQGLILW